MLTCTKNVKIKYKDKKYCKYHFDELQELSRKKLYMTLTYFLNHSSYFQMTFRYTYACARVYIKVTPDF